MIDVRTREPFTIKSALLIPEELFTAKKIEGEYWITYAINPVIKIEDINIRSKEDIFKITTKRKIYNQIFVLARLYLYLDGTEDHISFYFDGFPWSYLLKTVSADKRKKIDRIIDELQVGDCIEDDYHQIQDQFSRMSKVLLNSGHSLTLKARWAAIEALNPQNKIENQPSLKEESFLCKWKGFSTIHSPKICPPANA
ncbi:MAG: hypothetical protein GF317_00960 [Candidatus Lokiarchaeota archaeon]|nr:hypothetical protein [Candidatus Lokiarchaeota archaeon]MBD3198528.1 hypothetical protein [Candidatus Lokiarchaeota archaeon]